MYQHDHRQHLRAVDKVDALKKQCASLAVEIATAKTEEERAFSNRTLQETITALETAIQDKDQKFDDGSLNHFLGKLGNDLKFYRNELDRALSAVERAQKTADEYLSKVLEIEYQMKRYREDRGFF